MTSAIRVIVVVVLFTFCECQTNLYVSTTGNDSTNCSLSYPCMSLQGAINVFQNYYSDSNVTIEFSEGTYSGKDNIGVLLPNKTISIVNKINTTPIFQCSLDYPTGIATQNTSLLLQGIIIENCAYYAIYGDPIKLTLSNVTIQSCSTGIEQNSYNNENAIVEIENSIFRDILETPIRLIEIASVLISNSQFTCDWNSCTITIDSTFISIDASKFYTGIYFDGYSTVDITNCYFDVPNSFQVEANDVVNITNSVINAKKASITLQLSNLIQLQNTTVICANYNSFKVSGSSFNISDSYFELVSMYFDYISDFQATNCEFINVELYTENLNSVEVENIKFTNSSLTTAPNFCSMKNCEFINSPVTVNLYTGQYILDSILFQSQAVYLVGTTIDIRNCVFENITTERALFIDSKSLSFSNCTCAYITGVYFSSSDFLVLLNSNFRYITTESGIALHGVTKTNSIQNCTFYNIVGKYCGALQVSALSIEIVDSLFSHNIAFGAGGAIYASDFNSFNVSNTQFIRNIANSGGAITIEDYNDEATIQVSSCDFNSNIADYGAVFYCIPSTFNNILNHSFDSCTMEDNHSSTGKDTVYCTSSNGHSEKFWFGIGFACFAGVAIIAIVIAVIILKKRKKTQTYEPIN